jgi:hypothetical protein
MFVYQVIQGPACVPAGSILQLSDTQVRSRALQLRAFAGGWFIALAELLFETGDVVTFCHPLDEKTAKAFTPPELTKPIHTCPNQRFFNVKETQLCQ